MATPLKALDARQIEARGRARDLRVRVQVIEPQMAYSTRSQSITGASYNLDRTRAGWQCECKGWEYTGVCKHIAQVERRAEREGWSFGKVARPAVDPAPGLALLMGRPA